MITVDMVAVDGSDDRPRAAGETLGVEHARRWGLETSRVQHLRRVSYHF
jgi:hypothetical protein